MCRIISYRIQDAGGRKELTLVLEASTQDLLDGCRLGHELLHTRGVWGLELLSWRRVESVEEQGEHLKRGGA